MQVQIGNENDKMETTKVKKKKKYRNKNFVTVTKNTIDFKKLNVMCVLSHIETLWGNMDCSLPVSSV